MYWVPIASPLAAVPPRRHPHGAPARAQDRRSRLLSGPRHVRWPASM